MKAEIIGNDNCVVKFELQKDDKVYSDAGTVLWKSEGINQITRTNGGFFKGICRALTGETMFLSEYNCQVEKAEIVFSPEEPMKIIEFDLKDGEKIICQKGCFLCAENSIKTSTIYTKNFGESLFMQKIYGTGKVFLAVSYSTIEKELNENDSFDIELSKVTVMSNGIKFHRKGKNNFKNAIFGGLGFSKTIINGKGKVWIEQYGQY